MYIYTEGIDRMTDRYKYINKGLQINRSMDIYNLLYSTGHNKITFCNSRTIILRFHLLLITVGIIF